MTLKDLWNKLDVIAVLGFLIAIETQITNGSMSLAHTIPEAWIPIVKEWAANLASIGGLLVGIFRMAGAPSSSPPSSIPPAIVKLLMIAFLPLALLAMSSGAHAQGTRVHRSTNGQLCDPAGLLPGCPKPFASDDTAAGSGGSNSTNPILNALAKPFQDLANFIGADADGAATLATQIPQLQDVNGKACWVKMQAAGAVFKAHPVPLTFQIMTDFEAFRLLQMTANDLCSYTPCTVVFSDTSNLVTAVASAVGGVLTAGLQPQSLTTLCSRIPQLAPQLPTAVTGIVASSPGAASQSAVQPATTSTPATAPTPSASPTPNP